MCSGKNAVDYEYYLKLSIWSQFEFFCLLRGIDPKTQTRRMINALDYAERDKDPYFCDAHITDDRERNRVNIEKGFGERNQRSAARKISLAILKEVELFEPDIKLGAIPTTLINGENYYNRGDFINLAVSKGLNIPDELKATLLPGYVTPCRQETPKPKAAPVKNVTPDKKADKNRKKLIPLQRETNIRLLLFYEIFKKYGVTCLGDLSAVSAWAKIVSGDFSSTDIKQISEAGTYITLTDGTKLTKKDFSDNYRKRFKNPKLTNIKPA